MIPSKMFNWLLEWEGHGIITDDPDDTGGLTRWGISQKAYPDLDIRGLTREDANLIYHKDYWLKAKCDELPKYMQLIHFNCAVNCGVTTSIKILQRTIKAKPDGVIGRNTRSRIISHSGGPQGFAINYTSWLLIHYLKIVLRRRSQEKWARGWFRRAVSAVWFTAQNLSR
jgi:lysozyme family protein